MTSSMNDIPAGMQLMMGAFLMANKPYFPEEAFHMGMNHYARTCVDPEYRSKNNDDRVIGPFAIAYRQDDQWVMIPGSENNWSYKAAMSYARSLVFRSTNQYCLLNYAMNPCQIWAWDQRKDESYLVKVRIK